MFRFVVLPCFDLGRSHAHSRTTYFVIYTYIISKFISIILHRINARREVYRKIVNGREDLWDEYCRLRKEVKQLVIEKKLNIWNELVEKVSTDFYENKKEFWAFVGRKKR